METGGNGRAEARRTDGGVDPGRWAARIGVRPDAVRDDAFRREYPFEHRFHDLGGLQYHYVDEGAGEPVVMVHGNPTWSYFYRGLIQFLKAGHRCLAPDHIGCGLSEKPRQYHYDLESHIHNLEAWLEAALPPAASPGGRVNLVVHDWGGPIGIGYAVRHPERVRRAVILNTSVFTAGDMPFSIKICRWPVLGPILVRGMNLFASEASKRCAAEPLPQNIRDGFLLPYDSWANRVGVLRFVQDIPLVPGTPTHGLLREIEDGAANPLGRIPLLIQWGVKDWCFTPAFLGMWKKRFPEAEIDEYQAGHYLLEDAGEAIFPRIQKFLTGAAP